MRAQAYAKINLGLAVGPPRSDGKHEIATVLERVDLHDVVELEGAGPGILVEGFAADTLVHGALERFDEAADSGGGWHVRLEKRIPLASGLGGGSSDAAAALRLANEASGEPLTPAELHEVAAGIGSDVPFFLTPGAKLATGDGTVLEPVALPRDYWVVLALARAARKESTAAVYASVDGSSSVAFAGASAALLEAVHDARRPRDLAGFLPNQLVAPDSALGEGLTELGAFRVDTSGAGPAVYGLFDDESDARAAARRLRQDAETWLARPVVGP
jgi:4-diphosphocytidyl-2-C-methyl-D-erythritol kinase